MDDPVSHTDVIKEIKKLPNKKAPGVSGITNEILQNLPISCIPKLTLLFNSIFKFNHFPCYWKTVIIATILKPKKPPDQASSYRPIWLLDSLSKLAEVFIAWQSEVFIEENNIIMPARFDLRNNLSAPPPHQAYRLVEHITFEKIKKQLWPAVFLDIEKTFDKVDFALIYKLIVIYHFPPLIKLNFSYLKDRNFHVKIMD